MNAGDNAFVDGGGNTWAADQAFVPGDPAAWGYSGTSTGTYVTTSAIANTVDDTLYQSERYNMVNYRFTVPNGDYKVTLKFSENWMTAAKQRLFDVRLEGVTVMSSFDIFQAAGGRFIAVDRSFTVTVSDGLLNVGFVAVTEKPKVNAIEVLQIK